MTQPDERQCTLQELADSAGVSIRTIRYYIGEGLLPGPEGAGPQSHYTHSHASRLRAIGLLKERYLPLREIRRALAGLDDAEIDGLIDELGGSRAPMREFSMPAPAAAGFPAEDNQIAESGAAYDATSYIDRALASAPRRFEQRLQVPSVEGESWRRIEIADGAELLIREERYQRSRDELDWLLQWARKVID